MDIKGINKMMHLVENTNHKQGLQFKNQYKYYKKIDKIYTLLFIIGTIGSLCLFIFNMNKHHALTCIEIINILLFVIIITTLKIRLLLRMMNCTNQYIKTLQHTIFESDDSLNDQFEDVSNLSIQISTSGLSLFLIVINGIILVLSLYNF